MEQTLSSPTPEQLALLAPLRRSSLALVDLLDTELQDRGIPQRWYDILVHLEESPDGIAMTELADQILYSKSGFTRLIDRMEEAGLVRRVRPRTTAARSSSSSPTKAPRRCNTPAATTATASNATSPRHLTDTDIKALTRALEKISAHARPLRPGRIRG